ALDLPTDVVGVSNDVPRLEVLEIHHLLRRHPLAGVGTQDALSRRRLGAVQLAEEVVHRGSGDLFRLLLSFGNEDLAHKGPLDNLEAGTRGLVLVDLVMLLELSETVARGAHQRGAQADRSSQRIGVGDSITYGR